MTERRPVPRADGDQEALAAALERRGSSVAVVDLAAGWATPCHVVNCWIDDPARGLVAHLHLAFTTFTR